MSAIQHHQHALTIMTSTDYIPSAPIPIASSSSISPASFRITSVPMRRSPASMGVPRSPSPHASAVPMSRFSVNIDSAPRRLPAALPLSAPMGRELPLGGVAMERSKASMGTDYNPFYLRQAARQQSPQTPRTPVRAPLAPLMVPSTPASLPSPPASPTTPTPMSVAGGRCCEESALLVKRSVLTPRAFPVAFPDSPRSARPRRRRGLSAPPPVHLRSSSCAVLLGDGTRSLRVAVRASTAPIRSLPFHAKPTSVALVCADE